ncbi:MAG: IclR family transcriptional regulator [Thermoflexales bacterium]|nr:IclR family transcriptional regulator [Thermoflexales bacterium]
MSQADAGSLVKGIKLLEVLADTGRAMGVSELSRTLGLDKSTVYRLLATLKARGYVEQDPETRKYAVGPKMIAVSSRILGNNDVYLQARPVMKRLLQETRETVHLAMRMENQVVYIAQEISPEVVSVNTEMGQREPVHCTAVGKALVAFLPDEEREAVIRCLDFRPYTPRTITDPERFRAHCLEIRAQGYAVDDEELHPGVRCIAAPIRGYDGTVLASLGISGPTIRLSSETLPRLGRIVMKYAQEVSGRLGYLF